MSDTPAAEVDNGAAAAGPRAEERSRIGNRNARTHGLTAAHPATDAERSKLEEKVRRYVEDLGPEGEHERDLVRQAAVAASRRQRCVDAEAEALGRNLRDAVRRWEERKRKAIRKEAQGLREDPEGTVAELERSAFGCDWMLRHWRGLLARLDAGARWTDVELTRAFQLMGRGRHAPSPDDEAGVLLWDACVALGLRFHVLDPIRAVGPQPIAPGLARGALRDAAVEAIERLEARRAEAWEEVEAVELRAVEAEGLIDVSKAGQLRRRYEREADLSFNRNLGLLLRLRTARAKQEAEAKRIEAEAQRPVIHQSDRFPPKLLVGGGWYRERDATPAPPGFVQASEAPAPAAPPRRNEPPPAAENAPDDRSKSFDRNEKRSEFVRPSIGLGRRTGALADAPPTASSDPDEGRRDAIGAGRASYDGPRR